MSNECAHTATKVINTRKNGNYVYRRRECKICGKRSSSIEINMEYSIGNGSGPQQEALTFLADMPRDKLMAMVNFIKEFAT